MRAHGSLDSFGTILSGLAKRLGLESNLNELRVQREWRQIVGDPIAAHTWPSQIRFKKLYLIVRNSVWLQELTFLKPTLLVKLNERVGAILLTDIAFRVGEIPSPRQLSAVGDDSPAEPTISESVLVEASAHAAAVEDPDLRSRLTQIMAGALARSQR